MSKLLSRQRVRLGEVFQVRGKHKAGELQEGRLLEPQEGGTEGS